MTIASEISRLQCAKADICTAIENKGVTVGNITLDNYACCIDDIQTGSTIVPNIEVLIVGGGGGGGKTCCQYTGGGGGGGGGVKYCPSRELCMGCSYSITVGCGGAQNQAGGVTSAFGMSMGGGGAGGGGMGSGVCGNGGGGHGAYGTLCSYNSGGSQYYGTGFKGGNGYLRSEYAYGGGGGGGGAGGPGTSGDMMCIYDCYSAVGAKYYGGNGGAGVKSDISGQEKYYGGGGGGGSSGHNCSAILRDCGLAIGKGGYCSGGDGAMTNVYGCNGQMCGGGGGGNSLQYCGGGNGAPGVVIARYKTDGSMGINCATGGTIYCCCGYTIHCFTSNGTFTVVS